ncbi:hypothetical protein [Rhizobium skierniewicense]|uniref:hypothetical protein n=1 Tax=Rhizobium skierniewicense TaxID=984260 RepID=UPI0015748ECF|nr:hypothetical protein [Rhizobium skierniewicense]NTF33463.1 hypothetical protein [Rhizobium skierniewicense]
MNDETVDLSHSQIRIGGTILHSSADGRRRIAQACHEARLRFATTLIDHVDARPQIITCFGQSDLYREAGDIAFVGWILLAMEIQVNEDNLRDCERLSDVVPQLVGLLSVRLLTVNRTALTDSCPCCHVWKLLAQILRL